jgi:hypothetical protein
MWLAQPLFLTLIFIVICGYWRRIALFLHAKCRVTTKFIVVYNRPAFCRRIFGASDQEQWEVAQTNRSGPDTGGRERGKHGCLSHLEGMGRHAGVRLTNK